MQIGTMRMHLEDRSERRGSVLLLVLVTVALLALGAWSFAELMVTESEATLMYSRSTMTRTFADSGIEFVAATVGQKLTLAEENLYHNPETFHAVEMRQAETARGTGRFSVVATIESDPSASRVRFGLMNESGKLNLNTVLELGDDDLMNRERLIQIPNMTDEAADCMWDWIDDDDVVRDFGTEGSYYEGLGYASKDGRLDSLEELLMVRGVTPALLFGEDANRNGILDPNENDGALSPPMDNEDGILDLGWSAFLTVHSRESNMRADGSPRIDVNNNTLTDLYDAIEEEFGEDVATFVVAFRIWGPTDGDATSIIPADSDEEALNEAARETAKSIVGGGDGQVTRNGMDLLQGAQFQVESVFDLIGREVEAEIDGVLQTLVSPSPFTTAPADIQVMQDVFSTTDEPFIEGRININEARREILLGIPGVDVPLADAILASQMVSDTGEPLMDVLESRATTGWLVTSGLVELTEMRQLDAYITARGDVFRGQIIGYFDAGGPIARLEAIFDRTETPVRILGVRDLTDLGAGAIPRLIRAPTD